MAYQEAPSPPLTDELRQECREALIVLLPDGSRLRAGRAALRVLGHTGFGGLARLLARRPFVWTVETGYALIARHRERLSRWLLRDKR